MGDYCGGSYGTGRDDAFHLVLFQPILDVFCPQQLADDADFFRGYLVLLCGSVIWFGAQCMG